MKKTILASAAALMLAGVAFGTTQTASANGYNYRSERYFTQNGSNRRHIMKALRENKALQLTTILQDYQLDDEDYNGYYNYYSRLIYTLTDENTMDGHLDSLRDYLGSKENYQY